MATSLVDVRLLVGGYEVTTDHNQCQLDRTKDVVMSTTFGSSSHTYLSGLKSATYSLQGYFDADGTSAIDDVYHAQWVASGAQVTTIMNPGSATAYSLEGIHSDYRPFGGTIGDMAAFQIDGSGTGDSFHGEVFEAGTSARSTSSNSSGSQITGITTGEKGRAALHVIATTGSPTLDVTIESDDNGSFTTPTTVLTFTQATAQTAEFLSTSAATSDDYWRAAWTFGGTGSITFVVTFGIA